MKMTSMFKNISDMEVVKSKALEEKVLLPFEFYVTRLYIQYLTWVLLPFEFYVTGAGQGHFGPSIFTWVRPGGTSHEGEGVGGVEGLSLSLSSTL